jgi:hypothetical protein
MRGHRAVGTKSQNLIGIFRDALLRSAPCPYGHPVARRERLGLSVLDIGKYVLAGVDCRIAAHADQLIAEDDLEPGKNLEGGH